MKKTVVPIVDDDVLDKFIADGELINLQTALGTASDPREYTTVGRGVDFTNNKTMVDDFIRWSWGARKFISERPREALRKWIELDINQEDASKMVLDRLDEIRTREALNQALEWQDAYGGSAILILSGDSKSAVDELIPEKLSANNAGIRGLKTVSKWSLQPIISSIEQDPMQQNYGKPVLWTFTPRDGKSITLHCSRLLFFWGSYAGERNFSYEWGQSVLEPFWPAWRDYASSMAYGLGSSQRLSETRVYIESLKHLISNGQRETARAIIQEYALARSMFRMGIVDANDRIEDSTVNLSGVKDLVEVSKEQVAAASGFSVSRFFGTARSGLSDTDESAAQRDDAQIAEYQNRYVRDPLERLIELIVAEQSINVDTWTVRFRPLREESPSAVSERRNRDAQTDSVYLSSGAITRAELRTKLQADEDSPYPIENIEIETPILHQQKENHPNQND